MTAESRRETLDLCGETWDEGCFGWAIVPRQISKPLLGCKFVHQCLACETTLALAAAMT